MDLLDCIDTVDLLKSWKYPEHFLCPGDTLEDEAEIPLIMPPVYTMKDSDDGTEYRL
jgi:hypothetical protein